MKKLLLSLLALLTASSITLAQNGVVLNEIMASNAYTIADEDFDFEDWIELYNAGDHPVNLEDWGLSDDYDRPHRWVLPDITLEPGEFLLVWASNKDRDDPNGELHTNFAISSSGEEITLTDPDGNLVDEIEPTEIPGDISYGRYPDGTDNWYFFDEPTPGQANVSSGGGEILEPVSFSYAGGFYPDDFELTLTHPDPNVTIIYTLDGSEPNPDNIGGQTYEHVNGYRPTGDKLLLSFESIEYDDPIPISDRTNDPIKISNMVTSFSSNPNPPNNIFKGTVVRAKAIKAGAVSSDNQTHSYFVTSDLNNRYSLPVISFAIQEDYLFDFEDGIYVPGKEYVDNNEWATDGDARANQSMRGREWERPASMEVFDHNSPHAQLQTDMGVRIHGGWSRANSQKSLRLYARGSLGDSRFNYQFFPDLQDDSFNRLMLRTSGNDWGRTMFRDAAIQAMIGHMTFDTQAYQPYIVFINGEFWGLHNARERYDKHYLARVHGVDPENVDLLTANALVKEGDNEHYNATLAYIEEHGLEDKEDYEYIQTRIDVENFRDYFIGGIFPGNYDWPQNNIDFWRNRTDAYDPDATGHQDGRWRWLMFDNEFGFNLYGWEETSSSFNTLGQVLGLVNSRWGYTAEWATILFRSFMENETFQADFANRYLDQLNTAFRSERTVAIIEEMKAGIESVINEHSQRWGSPWDWEGEIDGMISYANSRPRHARNHLRNHFNATEADLTVNVSDPHHGYVQVNTIALKHDTPGVDENPWPWTGTYFEEFPVTLRAEDFPGGEFDHWLVDGEQVHDREIIFNLDGDVSVTAIFNDVTTPTGFNEENELPKEIKLAQNYPNPFNPTTVINYQLPVNSEVRLEVYDMLGRRVSTLINRQVQAGHHNVSFDASGLASGVYIYRMTVQPNESGAAPVEFIKKMTLVM